MITICPRAAGGLTVVDNLAPGLRLLFFAEMGEADGADPDSNEEVQLFNPRTQVWAEHFRWERQELVPLTPTGAQRFPRWR